MEENERASFVLQELEPVIEAIWVDLKVG